MEESFYFAQKYEDSDSLLRLTHNQYNKKKIFTLHFILLLLERIECLLIEFNSGQAVAECSVKWF